MRVVRGLRARLALARATVIWRLAVPIRSFLFRRKRIGQRVQPIVERLFRRFEGLFDSIQGDPVKRYQTWIRAYDTLDEADLKAIRREQSLIATPPLLSLVVPVDRASAEMLETLVQCLREQVYERWELCVVGKPLVDEDVTLILARASSRDSRVRLPNEHAASLADEWNAALGSAAGEFAVLVDPGVMLRPHALFLIARTIARNPDAVLVYADEDVVDEEGIRSGHYFKPDWNEALLSSQNYLGGLVAFRRSTALAVGGCRDELDDDCAWGLFLRMTAGAPPGTIHHRPLVLSHRRTGPLASHVGGFERTRVARALEERLARIGRQAQVEPVGESSYRTRYALPKKPPAVSVIIPSTCKLELLAPCLDGVLNRTCYADLDVLLVVNEIQKEVAERRDYLEAVAARPRVRVLYHDDRQFNFSWVNNWAVAQARSELLCFLNDDTEVIGSEWLSAMVGHILQDGVGAVGAMLFYPDDRIQHAGVVLGAGGVAAHTYGGRRRGTSGYHDRALIDQDVSCVTAACMVVRRDAFLDARGYEEALGVAFNDVDLCLRLSAAGWRIVWTPSAELYHRESVSTGRHDVGEREEEWEFAWSLMRSRWSEQLASDPYYSPNLSLDPLQLWEPAFPPRISYPWRAGSSSRRADAQTTAGSALSAGQRRGAP